MVCGFEQHREGSQQPKHCRAGARGASRAVTRCHGQRWPAEPCPRPPAAAGTSTPAGQRLLHLCSPHPLPPAFRHLRQNRRPSPGARRRLFRSIRRKTPATSNWRLHTSSETPRCSLPDRPAAQETLQSLRFLQSTFVRERVVVAFLICRQIGKLRLGEVLRPVRCRRPAHGPAALGLGSCRGPPPTLPRRAGSPVRPRLLQVL